MTIQTQVATNRPDCTETMCDRQLCRSLVGMSFIKRHRTLQRGDKLSLSEASCRKIWIIVKGMTALCVGLEDGRRQILGLDSRGDTVCGMSTGHQSGAWIEAFCDTVLCELDLQMLTRLGTHDTAGEAGAQLVTDLFGIIHQRLEACSSHLVTLGRMDSTERVTLFLLDMAQRIGSPSESGFFVELPMTREDIADYLGLNTETISRIFTRLKKSKLAQFPSRNAFFIPDPGALQRRLPVAVPAPGDTSSLDAFLSTIQPCPVAHKGVGQ